MKNLYVTLVLLLSVASYGDDYRKICNLVSSNDSVTLAPLLEDKKNVNIIDQNNRTLLFCAAKTGAYKSAELLLKKGIDPNIKDEQNLTIMNVLIENKAISTTGVERFDYIKTAMLFMDYGINVNSTDKYGNSLLMHTYSPEIVRFLLAYGADINSTNKEGKNLLQRFQKHTSYSDNAKVSILKSLMDYGANLEAKDKNGKSIFEYLHSNNKYDFFKDTQHPKKLEPKIIKEFLMQAMKKHDYEMIELLLEMGDYANEKNDYNKNPIILKAIDDSKIVDIFLKHGLDTNMTFNRYNPKSLLDKAIGECAVGSVKSILEHSKMDLNNFHTAASIMKCDDSDKAVEIADLLLKRGFNISVTDKQGHTLLHLAAKESKGRLCQYFLDKGIIVDIKDKEGISPIIYALTSRDNDLCAKILLKSGADIHQKAPKNVTLLHAAVKRNHIDVVKYLLDKGIDPNETDDKGHHALQLVADNAHFTTMNLLLEKGANLKAIDKEGNSVLHYACGWNVSTAMAKFLLEKGLDVNLKNKLGVAALSIAVKNNNLAVASYLMEHKAKINIQDNNGNTPLHYAVKKSNKKMIVLLLLKGADQNIKNKEGLNVLELANKEHSYSKEEYHKILSKKYQSYLPDDKTIFSFKDLGDIALYAANGGNLKIKNEKNESLLHVATKVYGKIKIVNYLLASGIDPNLQDLEGRTSLHLAAQFSNAETVHSLLQYGAKVEIKDKNNLTPADYAIIDMYKRKGYLLPIFKDMLVHGLSTIPWRNSKRDFLLNEVSDKPELISFLIKHGGDVNGVDKNGYTPLISCAVHNRFISTQILIDAGANPDIQEKRGRTALYIATRNSNGYDTAQTLLKNGANANLKTKEGDTPLLNAVHENDHKMVSLLLKYNTDPNIYDTQNNTALHKAVMRADLAMVKILLEGKANPDKTDDLELTPLDYAKKLKMTRIIVLLEPLTKVRKNIKPQNITPVKIEQKVENNISVQHSAMVDNKYMQTKLHQAVVSQNIDEVKKLLQKHVNVNTADKLGRTPLHYAAFRGYVDIAKLLLEKDANINAVDSSKQWTPLFFATFMHHEEMIKLLIGKGADQTLKDRLNKTADEYQKDK